VAFIFNAAFSFSLMGFFVIHARMLFMNCTTIELYEKARVRPWPYDKGWQKNFQEVFGRRCAACKAT
jgi:palmitoyltransferase ZDHHC2/15/20